MSDNFETCSLKEMKTILVKHKNEKKWPLLLDTGGNVATFLKYRDCNYLNCNDPKDMTGERIRMSILGGLRYGKGVVIELPDNGSLATFTQACNRVNTNLMSWIMSKEITKDKNYEKLLSSSDDGEYHKERFGPELVDNFSCIFVLKNSTPPDELKQKLFPILVN